MEGLIISGYAAIAIAMFAVFRLPLNRWTVPVTSLGGVFIVFALIQVLNFYHPHSAQSRQGPATQDAVATNFEPVRLIAWFRENQQPRLVEGTPAEITFDGIPGEVFTAEVRGIVTARDSSDIDPALRAAKPGQVPVLLAITDERYALYRSNLPGGSAAQAAVYGEDPLQLAVVRKTLLRMSAWMNYLSLPV